MLPPNELTKPTLQAEPSPGNGVCVPQRLYRYGTGQDNPKNRGREFFLRGDGSYFPVAEALEKRYDGLMNKDSPVLVEVGPTVITRFEVNRVPIFGGTLMFIGFAVAGVPVQRVPGESAEVELRGWGLRSRVSVTNH